MATSLFVAKISYNTTSESLERRFSEFGEVVSAKVIKDRETDQSRGFAFVEMKDDEAAQAAIRALDGQEFEGRTIAVNVAKPREDRPRFDGGNGGGNFRRSFR